MSEKRLTLCPHCRHRKKKVFKGYIIADYCSKITCLCLPNCEGCVYFKRSLKSLLGLVDDE